MKRFALLSMALIFALAGTACSGGDANAVMRALDGFALALHRLPGD